MVPGMMMTLVVREPEVHGTPPKNLRDAIVQPFREFVERDGWRGALFVLGFIFLYKLGDTMATTLSTSFFLDIGFSRTQIGVIAKTTAFGASLAGGIIGGIWLDEDRHRPRLVDLRHPADGVDARLRLARASRTGFAWLDGDLRHRRVDQRRHDETAVVGRRRLVGATRTALGRARARLRFRNLLYWSDDGGFHRVHRQHDATRAYTATQFALFTSLGFGAAHAGRRRRAAMWSRKIGWFDYFIVCTALAVPGMLLLLRIAPWRERREGAFRKTAMRLGARRGRPVARCWPRRASRQRCGSAVGGL